MNKMIIHKLLQKSLLFMFSFCACSIIVEAQKRIANNDVNIIYTTMYGLPKAGSTHLTLDGLVEHGKRIFNAYQIVSSENKKPIE